MTIPDTAPADPAESAVPARWFRRRRNLIGLAVVVLAAAGTAIGVVATRSGPDMITVHGTLTVGSMANDTTSGMSLSDGDSCVAIGGYSDINQGATVTIGGSTGQTLTVTGLSAGVETGIQPDSPIVDGNCVFSFSAQVPAGQSAYTVTVGRRGSQTFTAVQGEAGVSLALG